MSHYLLKDGFVINENLTSQKDVYIVSERIKKIEKEITKVNSNTKIIDCSGLYILPGMIDDQVHFREPGLTHKADIFSESRAAVAGGITSFMDMPNTNPQTITNESLSKKREIAEKNSWANYSFYLGATNNNLDELLKIDLEKTCGIKIFLGASTGNMLVDDVRAIENIFSQSDSLIATHCEDEQMIRQNTEKFIKKFGDRIAPEHHPIIRSNDACLKSSSFVLELAQKYHSRLHILHITTKKEIDNFRKNNIKFPITKEVCCHHLFFSDKNYDRLGNLIKCNPAIKTTDDRDALQNAVLDGIIDVIASDHAPHTLKEKQELYLDAPAGLPLVQHSLYVLFELYHQGKISLETIVEKTSHKVADLFKIRDRGYLREGYYADLCIVDLNAPMLVSKENTYYKVGWSPFEGTRFSSSITSTFVNGSLVYDRGTFFEKDKKAYPLQFLKNRLEE